MELGKRIKQLRLKAGLTQEQLAEKTGVGAQAVSKWENAVAMPDITLLPELAEIFGVSIDDLFELTAEQRLNRIENRLDMEDELPRDVFMEYEDFLRGKLASEKYKKRATELIAYLYWHSMNSYAQKVKKYAKEAVRSSPREKGCQWMLTMAEGHRAWDWNISNHSAAISFYSELVNENPDAALPCEYLIDNLIADRRADEAERYLDRLCGLEGSCYALNQAYRAQIALARFDEKTADGIMERLVAEHPDDSACLFETAQYFAGKCGYDKAIEYYERSFENEKRRPRYTDELHGIADIYEIRGEFGKAAETYGRIADLLRTEWGMTEETELKEVKKRMALLLEKANAAE